jgi:hypothetical protein
VWTKTGELLTYIHHVLIIIDFQLNGGAPPPPWPLHRQSLGLFSHSIFFFTPVRATAEAACWKW